MRSTGSSCAAGAVVLALLVGSAPARAADAKKECGAAYEAAQEQRSSGKLRQARESLVTCSQSGCKDFIKKDCAKWLAEVEASIPTVVFSAKAGKEDLTDVTVSLDGETLAASLDGRALPMDPGTRTFVFEHAKHGKKEVKFVVKEGGKSQTVEVEFVAGQAPATGDTTGDRGTTVGTEDVKESKALAYVLAGVGALGIGGFVYFGLSGNSDKNSLECADSKTCTDEDLDPIKKKYLYADISLGVGIVSLGVATYLLLKPSKKAQAPSADAARLHVDFLPARGGGFGSVSGSF